ncbi:Iwr1 domain-containing protein [Meloidogyne graminicola]|uniref:Iwr1 domain-containing protein n=1 Tax=Meloidogyne graminicola TaxID=189291 RepID=A0A8S9ZXU9_9BILA|nr:Iwr1 domain-containing protein [Meloidogyne graminicola]
MEIGHITADKSALDKNINHAPIAQEEGHDEDEFADEYLDLSFKSSSPCQIPSTSQRSESMIVNIGEYPQPKRNKQRRKRKDPFGNLILSTKKMKLNDIGNEKDKQVSKTVQKDGSTTSYTIEEADDMELFYGGDDESCDSADDDYEDSNDEQYYANDYPDEDDVNEFENESTSEDGYFDHYGDEQPKYRAYAYELSSDQEDFD